MWKYIGKSVGSIYGEVDEIRFWDDKRTATEIKDNMFKELSGNESNLIAYYKMTDESGNTVSDNSLGLFLIYFLIVVFAIQLPILSLIFLPARTISG